MLRADEGRRGAPEPPLIPSPSFPSPLVPFDGQGGEPDVTHGTGKKEYKSSGLAELASPCSLFLGIPLLSIFIWVLLNCLIVTYICLFLTCHEHGEM